MGTLSLTVLNATAHSPHTSAWSVTCEYIVQRLVNQCLEREHTAEIVASTVLTVLAHSLIAWDFSVTCASMTVEFTDNTDTACTPSAPVILTVTATPTTMNDIPPASTDFSCPQCACNFNSRISHSQLPANPSRGG
ncbi:unnamed protein product [Schistocephalus solidus]|uniref:Uncharacterized protein n=1 Tax=Schistocephalus solidus TaxID=70667 RepID=A0A183SBA8_SCHSO|nr:unnamed protein product [Schistocephalus solidus]